MQKRTKERIIQQPKAPSTASQADSTTVEISRRVTRSQSKVLALQSKSIESEVIPTPNFNRDVTTDSNNEDIPTTNTRHVATQTKYKQLEQREKGALDQPKDLSYCPRCYHLVRAMQEEIISLVKTNKVSYKITILQYVMHFGTSLI